MNFQTQIQALEKSTTDLAKAASIRDKVRLADQVYGILSECEKLVEHFVVTEIGTSNGHRNSQEDPKPRERRSPKQPAKPTALAGRKFADLTLAQIGKQLLEEKGGTIHGSEIEKLAKAGGFKSTSEHFQSYLAVAFKRVGGFENLGKNTWKLNPNVPPGKSRPPKEEANRSV
jgi:hypothetical protein